MPACKFNLFTNVLKRGIDAKVVTRSIRWWLPLLTAVIACASGINLTLPGGRLHLRSGPAREWSSFALASSGRSATVEFSAESNALEYALVLRQVDVKKTTWTVAVNGRKLGVLQDDERSMVRVMAIPSGTLRSGRNLLEINGTDAGASDDIEVREIRIERLPVKDLLTQSTIAVDARGELGPMPVKITIADAGGALVPFASLRAGAHEALRTGVVYTADGKARIGVPAGDYRIYASRGFEYSAPVKAVRARPGDAHEVKLRLRKEVSLPRYVSCDTHVHTYELSRHGDASVDERVLTAAGEGLDLAIITEHNRADDYSAVVKARGLEKWTRAVPGNEVTTRMGHFNIFPVRPGSAQPDARTSGWDALMDSLYATEGVRVAVLNHPRDLHLEYRPFDPAHHLSSTGTNVAGRPVRANAVEVVNSGAMHSDPLQLVRDWLGILTRGLPVAAIGSSDTHTVDFVQIGQARTYIESGGNVFEALAQGRNLVSYGLAAEARVSGRDIEVTVHGPSWSSVDTVEVYSNGRVVWRESFPAIRHGGVKYRRRVRVDLPPHDTAVVAVATGPGPLEPFWSVRKPYQPVSPEWTPRVLGVSAAVWVDGDGDNRIRSPRHYAEAAIARSGGDTANFVRELAGYDRSVAMHVLDLLRARGKLNAQVEAAFRSAGGALAEAYEQYSRDAAQLRSPDGFR